MASKIIEFDGSTFSTIRPFAFPRTPRLVTVNFGCESVPEHIFNFCMGHHVGPLKYDKQPWTDEGEGIVAKELQKIRPFLNLLTHRGEVKAGQSYFEQTVETIAISKGLDPEYLKDKLILYAAELPAIRAELAETKTEGVIGEVLEVS